MNQRGPLSGTSQERLPARSFALSHSYDDWRLKA